MVNHIFSFLWKLAAVFTFMIFYTQRKRVKIALDLFISSCKVASKVITIKDNYDVYDIYFVWFSTQIAIPP